MKKRRDVWEVSARSETGYVREANEDRMGAFQIGAGKLYVIADGIGGHNAGAQAAALTVQGLQEHLRKTLPELPVTEAIRTSFEKTNAMVYEAAHAGDPATEGMGSTAVLLLIMGRVAYVAHVGDSRVYLYRDGQLSQLTADHSQVQRMIDAGMLTSAAARHHPLANIIDRAIGNAPMVEVDVRPALSLEKGDGILLCSDGLCGYVDDGEIEAVLRSDAAVQELADGLVRLALDAGGHDNVSVQYIQYGERLEARRKGRVGSGMDSEVKRPKRSFLFFTVAVLIGACLSAGGFAFYSQMRGENFNERQHGPQETKHQEAVLVESFKSKLENLEAELNRTKQTVEVNDKAVKELVKESTNLRRDVFNLKKKLPRHR